MFGKQGYGLLKDLAEISEKSFHENRIQLEKAVEKINLDIVKKEEGSKSSNNSPKSPRNKTRLSKLVEEDDLDNRSNRLPRMQREKSKSIKNFKFLSQSRREIVPNLKKNSFKNKNNRVTYYVKPDICEDINQENKKEERHPSLILKSIDIDNSIDLPSENQKKKISNFYQHNQKIKEKRNAYRNTTLNTISSENIDKNASFLIEDPKIMDSWNVNRKERKLLNEKENEKFIKVFDDGSNDSFIFKILKKTMKNGNRRNSATFSEFDYQQEIYEFQGKYSDNKNEYMRNKVKIDQNKKVFERILAITVSGIIFEVCFASLSIIIMSTDILEKASKIIPLFFAIGSLEFVSSFAIFKLFSNIKSREMDNLRWITKVGNHKFSKHFIFRYPNDLVNNAEFPEIFENRLNFLTSKPPNQRFSQQIQRLKTRKQLSTLRTLHTKS